MVDPAYMTFYFNDGTKETVQAFTYTMGLGKLKKADPILYVPFWQMGKGEGVDELFWKPEEKKWVLEKDL